MRIYSYGTGGSDTKKTAGPRCPLPCPYSLYRLHLGHRRRHIHCAGMGVPVLKKRRGAAHAGYTAYVQPTAHGAQRRKCRMHVYTHLFTCACACLRTGGTTGKCVTADERPIAKYSNTVTGFVRAPALQFSKLTFSIGLTDKLTFSIGLADRLTFSIG